MPERKDKFIGKGGFFSGRPPIFLRRLDVDVTKDGQGKGQLETPHNLSSDIESVQKPPRRTRGKGRRIKPRQEK